MTMINVCLLIFYFFIQLINLCVKRYPTKKCMHTFFIQNNKIEDRKENNLIER